MTDTTEGRAIWEREAATAHGRARAAAIALAGMALTHLYLAVVGEGRLLMRDESGGLVELGDSLLELGQRGQSVLHLVTAVLFLRWLAKSVNVARLFQISPPLSWTASQACWGFFIPFINLVRPYQVIRDLHDRLAPDGVPEPLPKPRSDGVGGYRTVAMEKAPPPARLPHASIGAWWGLYLLGGWGAQLIAFVLGEATGQTVAFEILLPHGAEIASATLAMLVVRAIDGRLTERHRRLHHASDEELTEWGVTPEA